jgi:tetratricopeptide (TPR) repeat protein
VKFASQALSDITQKPHHKSETADYLLVLAEGYRRRFENYRAIDDWDQAVVCSNQAREANDRKWREGDFEVMCGAVQLSKATQPLELSGIESAIETLRKAVELTSSRGAPARVRAYHQLSLALRKKYEAAGQLAALEESKQWASQAVEIMPRLQVSCGLVVDNLSRIHLLRAQSENGDISDFVEAAKLSCVNIINTPHDNVAHLEYFKTLHQIFEEGGKCGPDAVEHMELAADECNVSLLV